MTSSCLLPDLCKYHSTFQSYSSPDPTSNEGCRSARIRARRESKRPPRCVRRDKRSQTPQTRPIMTKCASYCGLQPSISFDLQNVRLLVRERNFLLFVEPSFLAVLQQSSEISAFSFSYRHAKATYFSLSTLGSIITVSVLLSASQQ